MLYAQFFLYHFSTNATDQYPNPTIVQSIDILVFSDCYMNIMYDNCIIPTTVKMIDDSIYVAFVKSIFVYLSAVAFCTIYNCRNF